MTDYPILDLKSIPSLVLSSNIYSMVTLITPGVASNILEDYNYKRQRPLNERRVNQLLSAMEDQTFAPVASIMFSVENNKVCLVDGQHRLTAMRKGEYTYNLPVVITKIKADEVYPKIDRNKPRSLRDAIRSSQVSLLVELSEAQSLKASVGIKMLLNNYKVSGSDDHRILEEDIIMALLEDYKVPAHRFFDAVNGLEYGKKLTGRIPTAIFLALYKNLPEDDLIKVDEFIYGIGTNINLGEGDTRRLVYNMYTAYGRTGKGQNRPMNRSYESGNILTCWSYFFRGKKYKRNFSALQIDATLKSSPNLAGTSIKFKTKSHAGVGVI